MKIAVGSDHAGLALKTGLADYLKQAGHDVLDLGTHGDASVDYPDFAALVAGAVVSGQAERGLLVCGTGTGMAMSANKVPGARAAQATDEYMAQMAREHNDANVLCIGSRVIGSGLAEAIVSRFIDAQFEGGRHGRRVAKISELERKGE